MYEDDELPPLVEVIAEALLAAMGRRALHDPAPEQTDLPVDVAREVAGEVERAFGFRIVVESVEHARLLDLDWVTAGTLTRFVGDPVSERFVAPVSVTLVATGDATTYGAITEAAQAVADSLRRAKGEDDG